MISSVDKEAFVWVWLPNETAPVVAGRLAVDARAIFAHLQEVIEAHWQPVCREAELSEVDRKLLWRRQFLNPCSTVQ